METQGASRCIFTYLYTLYSFNPDVAATDALGVTLTKTRWGGRDMHHAACCEALSVVGEVGGGSGGWVGKSFCVV